MMSTELTRQAYIAMQDGDRISARTLLRRAIIKEPHNELAWYLLAQVVDKRDQAIDCLEQALLLNPNNEIAAQELASLKREKQRLEEPAPKDASQRNAPPDNSSIPPIRPAEPDGLSLATAATSITAHPEQTMLAARAPDIALNQRRRIPGSTSLKKRRVNLSQHRRRYVSIGPC
jgi:tetratricopeptide (TPR) repeat protein